MTIEIVSRTGEAITSSHGDFVCLRINIFQSYSHLYGRDLEYGRGYPRDSSEISAAPVVGRCNDKVPAWTVTAKPSEEPAAAFGVPFHVKPQAFRMKEL